MDFSNILFEIGTDSRSFSLAPYHSLITRDGCKNAVRGICITGTFPINYYEIFFLRIQGVLASKVKGTLRIKKALTALYG